MSYPETYHDEYNTVYKETIKYYPHPNYVPEDEEATKQKAMQNFQQQAVKYDEGKTDWAILPIAASEEIIKVFQFGAQKYSRGNYLEGNGLSYTRVINSTLRHIYSFMRGQDLDPESGLHHLAHAGCNIYMLLTYVLSKTQRTNDDRAEKVLLWTVMYKRLANVLNNTRRSLFEVCEDLDIDIDEVDPQLLGLDQCTHCGLWSGKLVPDLDHNPICTYCVHLIGM